MLTQTDRQISLLRYAMQMIKIDPKNGKISLTVCHCMAASGIHSFKFLLLPQVMLC